MLSQPGRDANVPRHIRATKEGLAELERRFGPYPYSQITVVDVPEDAEGAGGMEYPTLFFTGDAPVPPGVHFPEYVTMHELSHQYFYGLVGSDEVEEAWLDEGFTESMSDWGMMRMFGREGGTWDYFGHHFCVDGAEQVGYRGQPDSDPMETRAFDYDRIAATASSPTPRPTLVMRTLEGYLGADKFEAAMRHYYEKARFTHPRGEDFVRLFDEGAGEDLSWYWKPALWGSDTLDYEILAIEKRHKPTLVGLFDDDKGKRVEKEPPKKQDKNAPWISEVVLHRKGAIVFPVELKVVFEDGSEKREKWDGGGRRTTRAGNASCTSRRNRWRGPRSIPRARCCSTSNRWNNGKRVEAETGRGGRSSAGSRTCFR